jgi:hypothetical protein
LVLLSVRRDGLPRTKVFSVVGAGSVPRGSGGGAVKASARAFSRHVANRGEISRRDIDATWCAAACPMHIPVLWQVPGVESSLKGCAMTRATIVVITSDLKFESECQNAFRNASIFPVVVSRVDRAVSLLREFRADVIVLVPSDATAAEDLRTRITQAAGTTPLLVFATLPSPSQVAAAIRETLDRCESGSKTAPL